VKALPLGTAQQQAERVDDGALSLETAAARCLLRPIFSSLEPHRAKKTASVI